MKKIIAIYAVLLLGLTSAFATPNTMYFMEYLPYQTMMNPALMPICKSYVELPAISTISLYANTGGLSLNDLLYVKDGKLVTFMHPEYGNKDNVYNKLMRTAGASFESDISLLGFGFKVKNNGYVTINTSLRTNMNIGGSKDFVDLIRYGTQDTVNVNSFDIGIPMSATSFLDLGVGYSQDINDEWRIGGRAHLLYGLVNAQLNFKDVTLNISEQEWNIKGNFKGNLSVPGVQLYTDENNIITGFGTSTSLQEFFKTLDYSFGAALDFGAVYKPVPEVRISVSIKDLGFIVWKTNAIKMTGDVDYTYSGVEYPVDLEQDYSETNVGNLCASNATYLSMVNGKIYAGIEYSFLENMMSLGLVSKTSYNYSYWDEEITVAYNLRPCSWFGLSASYSLISGRSSTIGLGVNLRIPPFSIYAVSDYTPVHYTSTGIPYKVSAVNVQAGIALTFGCVKKKNKNKPIVEDTLPEKEQKNEGL